MTYCTSFPYFYVIMSLEYFIENVMDIRTIHTSAYTLFIQAIETKHATIIHLEKYPEGYVVLL